MSFDAELVNDSVLVAGGFTGTSRLGEDVMLESNGSWDVSLARYRLRDGRLVKATRWGSSRDERPSALAVSPDGSSIVASGNRVLRFRPDLDLEWERVVGTAVGTANNQLLVLST